MLEALNRRAMFYRKLKDICFPLFKTLYINLFWRTKEGFFSNFSSKGVRTYRFFFGVRSYNQVHRIFSWEIIIFKLYLPRNFYMFNR